MKKFLRILFLLSTFYFLFSGATEVRAEANANVGCGSSFYQQYPWCQSQSSGIGDLVGKFYQYALAAVGVAALGALIYGGILWTVSEAVGTKQEAKNWIWGAVYGLILLLSAVLLLKTINPQLVSLTEPEILAVGGGASPGPGGPGPGDVYPLIITDIEKKYPEISSACQGSSISISNCQDAVAALIAAESRGDPTTPCNHSGACGLMQITNGGQACAVGDITCINGQIDAGIKLLNQNYQSPPCNGTLACALAEYNGGPKAVVQSACCSAGYGAGFAYQCPYNCGIDNKDGNHAHVCSCNRGDSCSYGACTDASTDPNYYYAQTYPYVRKICGALPAGSCVPKQVY